MDEFEHALSTTSCPTCLRVGTLRLEWRLRAKPTGTYAIAGAQTKVVAEDWPYVVCSAKDCDFEKAGKR